MLKDETDLISEAKMVLDFNWTGEYTKPAPRLYPHQWSWDSALIAITRRHPRPLLSPHSRLPRHLRLRRPVS